MSSLENNQQIISIKNPCPMTMKRIQKEDGTLFCGSCSTPIIDFRDRSIDEIKEIIGEKKVCGVFADSQVKPQSFGLRYKFHYAVLTLIAFFGFNVKPINGQSTLQDSVCWADDVVIDEVQVPFNGGVEKEKEPKKSRRQKKWDRRHPQILWIGCPDF